MFTLKERTSLKYIFAKWCAFNMVALKLKCWEFKYIFYNCDEFFMKLLHNNNYHEYHKQNSKHHIEYLNSHSPDKLNWKMLFLTWMANNTINTNNSNNIISSMETILALTTIVYDVNSNIIKEEFDKFKFTYLM